MTSLATKTGFLQRIYKQKHYLGWKYEAMATLAKTKLVMEDKRFRLKTDNRKGSKLLQQMLELELD